MSKTIEIVNKVRGFFLCVPGNYHTHRLITFLTGETISLPNMKHCYFHTHILPFWKVTLTLNFIFRGCAIVFMRGTKISVRQIILTTTFVKIRIKIIISCVQVCYALLAGHTHSDSSVTVSLVISLFWHMDGSIIYTRKADSTKLSTRYPWLIGSFFFTLINYGQSAVSRKLPDFICDRT